MPTKPKQFNEGYASIFQDASVVSAFQYRPMYPPETLALFSWLIEHTDKPTSVLDRVMNLQSLSHPVNEVLEHQPAKGQIGQWRHKGSLMSLGYAFRAMPGGDHLQRKVHSTPCVV